MASSESISGCVGNYIISHTLPLNGHKKSVTCLDMSQFDNNIFCSGSEDMTLRLWDIRTMRAQKCYLSCFEGESIETVVFSKSNPHFIYACSGRYLYTFDVRTEGILLRKPSSKLQALDEETGEIQAAAMHPKGEYIAVGDDNGVVTILPLDGDIPSLMSSGGRRSKSLSKYHKNIIGSIAIRSNAAGSEIISGGFDCSLCTWEKDSARPQVSYNYSTAVEEALSTNPTDRSNILNPPFVQALDFGMEGRVVVSAVGNGAVHVHSMRDLKQSDSDSGHSAMATALLVADKVAISGGADRYIKFWDIDETVTSHTVSRSFGKKKTKSSSQRFYTHTVSIRNGGEIFHGRKVNAITGSKVDSILTNSHFVASDTSPLISVYHFHGS